MLIEIYLSLDPVAADKVDLLIANTDAIDDDQVLALCQLYKYTDGQVAILERKFKYQDVLSLYMASGDYDSLLRNCERYEQMGHAELWLDLLRYFAGQQSAVAYLKLSLDKCIRLNLLPLVDLVSIVS